ncbi:hypothetical protein SAMN04487904_104414 [Actinopolyspora lacussalsi subsp. righensis]|uniref:Uncharacterized protein n=1 Tax=Actinopolyspora righensis TaxID=995060 RepID=A0A1I6ZIR0_9ACTN|nr:hypothetical protein [Actinopolyspora righensis]SFT62576.1 hypothetical protein SAMN04487904_104414 [Actinopolyspora righensis]
MDEHERDVVRGRYVDAWSEHCEVIYFRWEKFELSDFNGREEIGTRSIGFKIGFVVFFPLLVAYAWIREWFEAFGLVKESYHHVKPAPGVISVSGSKDNPGPTSLIDTVKRTQRRLWLVVSHSRVAVVVLNKPDKPPRVVWQSDESSSVRFHHASQQSIEVAWPDGCRAYFCPTIEERKLITRFVNATWNNEPR